MDISKYQSVGAWFEDARKQGYAVPLSMCQGLTETMEKYGLTFPLAFKKLENEEKIILAGRSYAFDLSAIKRE